MDWKKTLNISQIIITVLLVIIVLLEKYFDLKNLGLAIGTTLFSIVIIVSLIYRRKNKKKEPLGVKTILFESTILLIIFIFYSILSWALFFNEVSFIRLSTLFLIFIVSLGAIYTTALIIWSRTFFKNKSNPFLLILSYLIITILIIFLFAGFYASFGGFSMNNQEIPKENLTQIDYIGYSVTAFVSSSSYGGYQPLRESNLILSIESYLGMFFNVIAVGIVLSRYIKKENKEEINSEKSNNQKRK